MAVQSAFFSADSNDGDGDEEVLFSLDTHVMSLKVRRRTRQSYTLEQQPRRHVRMPEAGGRIMGGNQV